MDTYDIDESQNKKMPSDRSQLQKTTKCMIPFIGNKQNRQIHRQKVDKCLPRVGIWECVWLGSGERMLIGVGFVWGAIKTF